MRLVCVILMCFTLTACPWAKDGGKDKPEQPKPKQEEFVRLFPITSESDFFAGLPKDEDWFQEVLEGDGFLKEACTDERAGIEALGATALSIFVGTTLKLIVSSINDDVQKELKQYSKEYGATHTGKEFASKCWRLTRGTLETTGEEDNPKYSEAIYSDFIFKIQDDNNWMAARPLRSIIVKPAPKKRSVDNKYGLAINLSIRSIVNSEFKETLNGTLLKTDYDYEGKPIVKHYKTGQSDMMNLPSGCSENAAGRPLFCKPRDSYVYGSALDEDSLTQVTATVVEVGNTSKFLKFFAKVFDESKDDIGEALAEVAEGVIKPEDGS